MGKLSGTILILAGVTLAASALSSQQHPAADVAAPRAGGESTAWLAPAEAPKKDARLADEALVASPAAPPQPTTPTPAPPPEQTALTPPAEVSAEPKPHPAGKFIPPRTVRVDEAPPRTPVGQYEPAGAPPLDRAGLTREIQRHLKRVGCYGGAITGVWSPSVRRAMKTFTDRVNATLPIDEPDQVLLAMVENHKEAGCSASCPPGQGMAGDGRCVPEALVTRAGKQPAASPRPPRPAPAKTPDDDSRPTAAPSAMASRPAVLPPPEGRMSLAGPRHEPPPSAKSEDRAKAPSSNRRRRDTVRQARPPPPPRYAETPPRHRRYDYRNSSVPPGIPWWAIPALTP